MKTTRPIRIIFFLIVLANVSFCASAQKKANFNKALKLTLAKECGYVNHKSVPGGETYCGITRESHADWAGWKTIDKRKPKRDEILPELNQAVAAFYRTNYWNEIRGDEIKNQKTANKFFDEAVRRGRERAIMDVESKYGFERTGIISDKLIDAINSRH